MPAPPNGCCSAQVCVSPEDPDTVLVVSRWESAVALRAFLDRHESHAHGVVSPYAAGPPRAVHYRVDYEPPVDVQAPSGLPGTASSPSSTPLTMKPRAR